MARNVCTVDGCHTLVKGLGLCEMHYYRMKRTGSTLSRRERIAARTEKPCSVCGLVKPLSEFYRSSSSTDGLGCYCRTCSRDKALAWYYANPERARAREAATCAEDARRRRARERAATIVEFTPEQLAARLSMFAGCWVCGGDADSVDHVKPLARGGPHVLANLRPICRPCNGRKAARWPFAA